MLKQSFMERLNIGGRRLEERHTAVEFNDHKFKIGDILSDGTKVSAETRYMMNYFAGNTAYLKSANKLAGVVQMQRRDTGVISVIINENEYTGRGISMKVAGTKSVQKDVLAEATYIHALETCYSAYQMESSETLFTDVFEALKDVRVAMYSYSSSDTTDIQLVKAVDNLTDKIERAIEDASRVVQAHRGADIDPVKTIRSYMNWNTLDAMPGAYLDSLNLTDKATSMANMAIHGSFTGVARNSVARKAERKRDAITDKTTLYTRISATPVATTVPSGSFGSTSTTPVGSASTPSEEEPAKDPTYKVEINAIGEFEEEAIEKLSELIGEDTARTLLRDVRQNGPFAEPLAKECTLDEANELVDKLEGSGLTLSVVNEQDGVTLRNYKTKDPEPKISAKPVYPSEHKDYIHKKDQFYDALMAGEYRLDLDEFAPLIVQCYQEAGENVTEEQISAMLANAKKHIPSEAILETYVPIKDFQTMILSMRNNLTDMLAIMKDAKAKGETIPYAKLMKVGVKNWYLVGPPSAGKSISAQAAAAALGLPYYSVAGSRNVEEDMFQGGLGIKDGRQDNIGTPYVEGIHNIIPSIISIEEINALAPGVALTLNSHCEVPHTINLYGQQMVRRNPGAFLIASGNRDLAGLQEQNLALLSRFCTLDVEAPSAQALEEIVKRIVPYASAEAVKYSVDSYLTVLTTIRQNNFDIDKEEMLQGITIRGITQAENLIAAGIPPLEAVKKGLLGTVVSQSEESYKILTNALDTKPVPRMPETER